LLNILKEAVIGYISKDDAHEPNETITGRFELHDC
jgi:hypothetical protein